MIEIKLLMAFPFHLGARLYSVNAKCLFVYEYFLVFKLGVH